MIAFRKQGHRVISLSQASGRHIHDYLKQHDVETYTHQLTGSRGFVYYLRHLLFFISFCRKHKVDVVYSHLEPANIVCAAGQYFVKARIFIVRHHIDEARLQMFDRSLSYRLTYGLAKRVIVVSDQAKKYMISVEKADPKKIAHINLAYDFDLYAKPNLINVTKLRDDNRLTLITACRFTKYKRANLSIEVIWKLKERNVDARLILLGRGEDEGELRKMVERLGLTNNVEIPGYVTNITDYLAASDFLLHPSVLESSCVVAKEAAITDLPVIACSGVGDFDDYIEHEQNGFLVDQDRFVEQSTEIILNNMNQSMDHLTKRLHQKVREVFGVENIIHQYEILNNA